MIVSKKLKVPKQILSEIEAGATLAISISGGKDSQAMLKAVVEWLRSNKYKNEVFAIHSDLGSVEWPQTMTHCANLCEDLGIDFFVVSRKGGLITRWKERMYKLEGTGKPFWSSSQQRYCTSDLKREVINKFLRRFTHIISVEGIRWEEGKVNSKTGVKSGRASKPAWEMRGNGMNTRKRRALTWNAIIDWSIEDVWQSYKMSTHRLVLARRSYEMNNEVPAWWPFHPAYAMGNERLSCMICILGSLNDIKNGIKHNPELAKEMSKMEIKSGFTFRKDLSITELIKKR